MTCFVRLRSLYNYEPRKDGEPQKGNKPAKKRNPRVGLLAVGKTKLHEDYLLHDPSDPLIPGTDVPRLSLVYLGPKTPVTTDDEVNRVIAGLQRWAAERDRRMRQAAARMAHNLRLRRKPAEAEQTSR
jgi:hypothetical protein